MTGLLILLVVLPAIAGWLYLLRRWLHWWTPDLLLAVVGIIDCPEPEPETHRLVSADLTVADVRWGRATWAASRYDLVHPA